MSEKPPWRRAIEEYERSIGAPMEEFVRSDEFADLAAKAAKGQAQMQRELTASTTQWLHSLNLPAASDIAELRAEIQELRAEVRALAAAVGARTAAARPEPKKAKPRPEPKKAAARPKAKKAKPRPKPKPA